MNKRLYYIYLYALIFVGLNGCSSNDEFVINNERRDINISSGEMNLIRHNNDFALRLIGAVKDGNSQVVSPLCAMLSLAMLSNGADGDTKQEICQTLGYDAQSIEDINSFCKKMLMESPNLDKTVTLKLANNIFVNSGYSILPSFKSIADTFYGVVPQECDFSSSSALATINGWCSDQTDGLIPMVLDNIGPSDISCLLSAVYFNGMWTDKFPRDKTQKVSFKNGKKKHVSMMQRTGKYYIAENDILQLLRIPYGNGAFQMTVMLPREGQSLDDIVQLVDGNELERIQNSIENKTVEVWLPTFETKSQTDMAAVLMKLGITKAFSATAEFPAFCNTPIYISTMKQCSDIKINEEGTEAVSATAVVAGETANIDPFRAQFHADHPFIYFIQEKSTETIFFIGIYQGD